MSSAFVESVLSTVIARNPAEPEFIQAVREVVESLDPVIQKRPE
jgi:glutamate dehydrogenase (NADP+)